jgi:hypothetical protein
MERKESSMSGMRVNVLVWLLERHDWLHWHCRWLWTQTVNDFLLRRLK